MPQSRQSCIGKENIDKTAKFEHTVAISLTLEQLSIIKKSISNAKYLLNLQIQMYPPVHKDMFQNI